MCWMGLGRSHLYVSPELLRTTEEHIPLHDTDRLHIDDVPIPAMPHILLVRGQERRLT